MKHIIRNCDGSVIEEEFRISEDGRKCSYYVSGNRECQVTQSSSNGILDAPAISWDAANNTDGIFAKKFVVVLEFAVKIAELWNKQSGKTISDIPDWY